MVLIRTRAVLGMVLTHRWSGSLSLMHYRIAEGAFYPSMVTRKSLLCTIIPISIKKMAFSVSWSLPLAEDLIWVCIHAITPHEGEVV